MSIWKKTHNCELYRPDDGEIIKVQTLCLEKLYDYNANRPLESTKRRDFLK